MQSDESGRKDFLKKVNALGYISTLARWSVKSTLIRLFCCIRKLHNPPCIIHSRIVKCTAAAAAAAAAATTLGDVVG
jgi:hypothetical protein